LPGDAGTKLLANSQELGLITYELKLQSKPARPEKPLVFSTSIGNSHTQTIKFLNFLKGKTEYSFRIDSGEFVFERTMVVSSPFVPTEVSADIVFEPTKVGETNTSLIISAPSCGEYVYPLVASCIPAKPQGPFIIKMNATFTFQFKNINPVPGNFTYVVVCSASLFFTLVLAD
jgi:hydrocephalus-inducing protein